MRPKERRDSGQNDFFKARLDQIIDRDNALAKLGRAIDWRFLEERFGAVYSDTVGHPPLPTRLMAGSRSSSTCMISPTRNCARAGSYNLYSETKGQAAIRPPVSHRPRQERQPSRRSPTSLRRSCATTPMVSANWS
jgi:hypothetical protein